MTRLLTATSALALLCGPVAAQTFDLGEITIFTNRAGEATELDRTGATVEIVTEEDLRAAPETRLADVLATLPGVTASSDGGLGGTASLRIRGLGGKYIKVLVDGIDVTDPSQTQTQFNWGNLTTAGVSRIELLKGSASSVYGSRAIAGVVNITTRLPEEPGTEAEAMVEGGSYDTWRAGATIAHRGDRGGLSFSLNRVQTDGFSARAAGTEPDGFEAWQLNFLGEYQATDALTLGLSGFYLDAEGDFDEFGGDGAPPFDEVADTRNRGLRAYAELALGTVTHTLSASYFEADRLFTSNGIDTRFDGTRTRFDYQGVYQQSAAMTFTFGTDWEEETFESGADSGDTETLGVFGELLYAPNDALDLSMSLRWDDHSEFGSNLSGRLAAAYRLSDATTIRAVAATGFRAPSLYELNSTLYGNPALEPEESLSFELGIEHQLGGGSFIEATAFHTEIDDLIQFVTLTSFPLPFTGQYRQVPGTSTSQGIELSGEWVLDDRFTLFGNYTYTDAEDATGAQLLRVPTHNALLGLGAEFGNGWGGDLSVHHVADRAAEFGVPLDDYTVVNAALRYDVSDRVQAYMRLENLFDEDYQTSAGYNASGRAVYFGVRGTF